MMQTASSRYNYKKHNPRKVLPEPDPVPGMLREYNNKLRVLLLPAIPDDVKTKVLGDIDERQQPSALTVLDEVWHYVAPGGKEELKGLARFVRDPGTANTAEEALKRTRLWMQARKRAVVVGTPELSPHEQMQVLEKLIKNLEKKHEEFTFRLNQI
eukprot:1412449-Lingulodinium_polyedra.AAC.1